jgi:hypothetical protein
MPFGCCPSSQRKLGSICCCSSSSSPRRRGSTDFSRLTGRVWKATAKAFVRLKPAGSPFFADPKSDWIPFGQKVTQRKGLPRHSNPTTGHGVGAPQVGIRASLLSAAHPCATHYGSRDVRLFNSNSNNSNNSNSDPSFPRKRKSRDFSRFPDTCQKQEPRSPSAPAVRHDKVLDPHFLARRAKGRKDTSLLLPLLLNSQRHPKPRRAAHRTCAAERGGRSRLAKGTYSLAGRGTASSGRTLSLGYLLTEGNPVGLWVSKEK